MSRRDEDYEQVEVYVDNVKAVTDEAVLCEIEGEETWLPWSQIDDGSEIEGVGDEGTIWIPQWLASEKGIG